MKFGGERVVKVSAEVDEEGKRLCKARSYSHSSFGLR